MRKLVVAALALGILVTMPVGALQDQEPETFIGNAISTGGRSGTSRIQLRIDRWNTPEERQAYLALLAEGGQEALVKQFQQSEIGRARVGQRNSYPISYAYQFVAEDGTRRVVIATDRPIGALEAVGRASTMEWGVSIVELRMPPEGNGEGALVVAGAVVANAETHTLSLENYGQAPVRLSSVRSEK
ncbi:MAG: hypothetical protein GKS06_03725 [Acidobacteria bacterium]|nr:hypothetical protein [Acidobacteriota bacterium]